MFVLVAETRDRLVVMVVVLHPCFPSTTITVLDRILIKILIKVEVGIIIVAMAAMVAIVHHLLVVTPVTAVLVIALVIVLVKGNRRLHP